MGWNWRKKDAAAVTRAGKQLLRLLNLYQKKKNGNRESSCADSSRNGSFLYSECLAEAKKNQNGVLDWKRSSYSPSKTMEQEGSCMERNRSSSIKGRMKRSFVSSECSPESEEDVILGLCVRHDPLVPVPKVSKDFTIPPWIAQTLTEAMQQERSCIGPQRTCCELGKNGSACSLEASKDQNEFSKNEIFYTPSSPTYKREEPPIGCMLSFDASGDVLSPKSVSLPMSAPNDLDTEPKDGSDGDRSGLKSFLSYYMTQQRDVKYLLQLNDLEWYDLTWYESADTLYGYKLKAQWFHANFNAELVDADGIAQKKLYFAEVVKIYGDYHSERFEVTSCVPVNQNNDDPAGDYLQCEICKISPRMKHPSSELYVADDSSLHPSKVTDWKEAKRLFEEKMRRKDLVRDLC